MEQKTKNWNTVFFRSTYVDQILFRRLGSHVNVFSNKPYVTHHHNCKQNTDVAYYGLYDRNKIRNCNLYSIKLSENIYFIGVTIDSLHTISLTTKTPTFLP